MKTERRTYTAQFYRQNRFSFFLAALSTLLIAALNLLIAWVVQQMIDSVSGAPGVLGLPTLALLILLILLLIFALKSISYVSLPRFLEKAMRQYKDYTFQKLTQKNLAVFDEADSSLYISAFSNDAAVIESNYLEAQFPILANILQLVGAMAMMLSYSPILTLAACAFFILPIGASLLAGNKIEQAERIISDRNSSLTAVLKDSLNGFSVMKSFKAELAISALFHQNNTTVEQAKCKKRKLTVILEAISGAAGVTAQLGTFLFGAYLALSGQAITPGVLIFFIELTAYVILPVQKLPEQLAARKAALALIDKLAAALNSPDSDGGVSVPNQLVQGIKLNHVSFGYEPGRPILQDIHMHFQAGKSYAIVGASGSGKTTLLNLLMAGCGHYSGEITYDGQELRTLRLDSLYDLISVIQQNVFVFNASIRDNITMFHEFPEASVEQAIQQAGLSSLISERDEHALCGENGSGLSGGEKQRIAIARSLLKQSQVLLVDEATAALDAETACQVTNSILNLSSLTRIVVTHRLDASLLRRYDCILSLKNGRIEECGTFDELMQKRAYFYSLFTVSQ